MAHLLPPAHRHLCSSPSSCPRLRNHERRADAPPLRPRLRRRRRLVPGPPAEGLLADSETRVIYGQPGSEVQRTRELLGLSDTEAGLLPQLPRGQALWKIGARSFLVDHRLSAVETALVNTDQRMTA